MFRECPRDLEATACAVFKIRFASDSGRIAENHQRSDVSPKRTFKLIYHAHLNIEGTDKHRTCLLGI
jgi:hypothetical protein